MPAVNLEFLHAPAPVWVGALFVACTGLTAVLLGRAVQRTGVGMGRFWLVTGVWLAVQAGVALLGFYQIRFDARPPRLVVGAILPPLLLLVGVLVVPAGRRWLARLPLADLAAISVVRFGVELGLFGLAVYHLVPTVMTFEGRNFDILAGLTALVVAGLWRQQRLSRTGLLAWHVLALALLANIVVMAMLAAPSPVQRLAFAQPNVAVLRFPFVWLPAYIVPVVLFSHIASLYQLLWQPALNKSTLPNS